MKLIGIAYQFSDLSYRCLGKFEKLCRPVHPVINEELLGRLVELLPENLAQIASVQIAEYSNILHCNGMAVVLLDKADGLPDIEVLELAGGKFLPVKGGLDQQVEKEVEMSNLIERRVLFAVEIGRAHV